MFSRLEILELRERENEDPSALSGGRAHQMTDNHCDQSRVGSQVTCDQSWVSLQTTNHGSVHKGNKLPFPMSGIHSNT